MKKIKIISSNLVSDIEKEYRVFWENNSVVKINETYLQSSAHSSVSGRAITTITIIIIYHEKE